MATWLITGANRGIGLEMVRQLAAKGERVIATARDPGAATELRSIAAQILPLDVASPASVEALGVAIQGLPIDILVNNAGVSSTSKTLATIDAAEMARVMAINAMGPILTTKAAIDSLRAGSRKLVVHITSQLGSIANNSGGSTYAYRASKAALNQFNRSLSNELAPEGFTCVAIHPGWVKTDMGGPSAHLTPEQSVRSMLGVIATLGVDRSGAFLNYDGQPLPW
jgi:NAD(P)-dependent dehydrogenase (short-subunit alcohol dehydrogenase family)